MSKTVRPRRSRTRIVLAASFAVGAVALTGAGVYAGLNATATGTQSVASGTLSLTLANGAGSVGFGQTISNMAPGDVNNTYVDLTNGNSLAAQSLTLGVIGTGSTLLTTNAAKGLAVTVNVCSSPWTAATGVCAGGSTIFMASTPVSTLSGTPGSLVAGAVPTGTVWHLQVSLKLPDQSETTVNGITPTTSIQGLNTMLTYTFAEAQRTASTTNS